MAQEQIKVTAVTFKLKMELLLKPYNASVIRRYTTSASHSARTKMRSDKPISQQLTLIASSHVRTLAPALRRFVPFVATP